MASLRSGKFTINGKDYYDGLSFDERPNGWIIPLFSFETASNFVQIFVRHTRMAVNTSASMTTIRIPSFVRMIEVNVINLL